MQPQHSCGTLESRIKIFGCTVQELYITLYPLDQQQAAGEAKHSAENTINFSGSKRQPVSVHRQRPRAVQPVLRAGKYKQKGGLRWIKEEWTPR